MEGKYKLFAFDPTDKYPEGSFSAYESIPEGCDPATIAIGEKCKIPFKKNSKSNSDPELFTALFLYEGDVEVCIAFKELMSNKKRTYKEVIDANGSEEEAAKALRDAAELKKSRRNAVRKSRNSNGKTKRRRINSEEELNDEWMNCPIVGEGERLVRIELSNMMKCRCRKLMREANEEVEKMEEKRKVAGDDVRVAAEAAERAWNNANAALECLKTLEGFDIPRKKVASTMKDIKDGFKKWVKDKVDDVSDDEEENLEDPSVASVRRGYYRLVEIAKTADSEKIAKSKILEETTEKMKESKNNFNLRKKHFQEIKTRFGALRTKHRELIDSLNKMKNPVMDQNAPSKNTVLKKNDCGENRENEGNEGDQTETSTPNGAATPPLTSNAVEEPVTMPDEPNGDEHLPGTDT